MDAYGRALLRELPDLPSASVDLRPTSAGTWGVAPLSRRSLRGFGGDLRLLRHLHALRRVPHFVNHHLARYGPLTGRRYLVTAHDLIRLQDVRRGTGHISEPGARDRAMIRLDYRGVAMATGVIAPSEATRRELVDELGINPERIRVVPMGVDHELFRPVPERPIAAQYLLFVGSEHPRKGLSTLFAAFAELKARPELAGLRLVKVGSPGSDEGPYRQATLAAMRRFGLDGHVLFTGRVDDRQLRAFYSGAECLVLPSRAEGFGLPALEAMACGCPAVVARAGALPETAGDAALVFETGDVRALRAALEQVLGRGDVRWELRRRGLVRAAGFSWRRTAAETLSAYEALLGAAA